MSKGKKITITRSKKDPELFNVRFHNITPRVIAALYKSLIVFGCPRPDEMIKSGLQRDMENVLKKSKDTELNELLEHVRRTI